MLGSLKTTSLSLSWFDGVGVPALLPPGINRRAFASCFSSLYTMIMVHVEGEMAPLEGDMQTLVPMLGAIASLGLCPLSEALSYVLEWCKVNCGHPCIQHDVVSEKYILPGSFQSRLEEEELGILFRLLGKLPSLTQLCTLGNKPPWF